MNKQLKYNTMSRPNILVQWLCSVLDRKVPHQQFACFISHSSGAPSPTVESLFSRSFIHPRFQFPIHPMTWLLAQVTHLIHPRHPSHNSSQDCFCYFIHFNPIHGLGAAGFGPGPIIGFFVVFSSCSIFLISAAWLFHSSVDIFLRSSDPQRRLGGGKKPLRLSLLISL